MFFTLFVYFVTSQPVFPPETCSPSVTWPCSITNAVDSLTALKTGYESNSNTDFINNYHDGVYDVVGFEPLLFDDEGNLYGAVPHAVNDIDLSEFTTVLSELSTSPTQDWNTMLVGTKPSNHKFIYFDKLDSSDVEYDSGVFMEDVFADPWAPCAATDGSFCSVWNMGISVAKTFFYFSTATDSDSWTSTTNSYSSGAYQVESSAALVFDAAGSPLTNTSTLATFPTDEVEATWFNLTQGNTTYWAFFLNLANYNSDSYMVVALLEHDSSQNSDSDACTICDEATDVQTEVENIVTDDYTNTSSTDTDAIQDVIDDEDNDATSVTVVDTNDNTQVTITNDTVTEGGLDTDLNDTLSGVDVETGDGDIVWVWVDDDLGVVTQPEDGVYVITMLDDDLVSVADGTCDSSYNQACNTDACPYYSAHVAVALLNGDNGSSSTRRRLDMDSVLQDVRDGDYDWNTGYKPAVASTSGVIVAQSSEDQITSQLSDAQLAQLAWIAASTPSGTWVPIELSGDTFNIWVQLVDTSTDYVVILGYRDEPEDNSGGEEATTGDSDSGNSSMTVMIIVVALVGGCCCVIGLTVISYFFCKPEKKESDIKKFEADEEEAKSKPERLDFHVDAEMTPAQPAEGSHWNKFVPMVVEGTQTNNTAFPGAAIPEEGTATTEPLPIAE